MAPSTRQNTVSCMVCSLKKYSYLLLLSLANSRFCGPDGDP